MTHTPEYRLKRMFQRARQDQGLTQQELADLVTKGGVPIRQQKISNLERFGKIDLADGIAIAQKLKIPLDNFDVSESSD